MFLCLQEFLPASQTKPSPCNLVTSFPEMSVMPLKCSGIIKSSCHRWTNFGGKRRCVCVCETLSGPNSYGQLISNIGLFKKLFSCYNDSQVALYIAFSYQMLQSESIPSFVPCFLACFLTLISTYHSPPLSLNSSAVLSQGLIHEDTNLHLYCF